MKIGEDLFLRDHIILGVEIKNPCLGGTCELSAMTRTWVFLENNWFHRRHFMLLLCSGPVQSRQG